MATIEQTIDYILRNDIAISTAVGSRIYYLEAPENTTLPYIAYTTVIDTDEQLAFGDSSTGRATVQFDIVSTTRSGISIRELVRAKFRNYSGTPTGMATIIRAYPGGIRSFYLEAIKAYQETIDFIFDYRY